MKKHDSFTVITGASKGLGKRLAIECAKRGKNIILVALAGESVSKVGDKIAEKFKVKTVSYETDLTILENINELVSWIKANYKIDMLINNAGIGGTYRFENSTTDYIENIIQLNMAALVHLSHQLLPLLKAEKKSHILNIASLAAFGPMPFKTVYPASKAFVSSFSRGLSTELKETSVSVSVAYPGGMPTSPEIAKRMRQHNMFLRATFLPTERIAELCIKKALRNQTVIIPGIGNKINRFIMKFTPEDIMLGILSRSIKKEIRNRAASS